MKFAVCTTINRNTGETTKVRNFNPTVVQYSNKLLFLRERLITLAKHLPYKAYIKELSDESAATASWMTILRVAIDIYNGELKGFGKVPDEKELRE